MEIEHIVLNASITIFSLGMFIVSYLSFKASKNHKLLFVNLAFFVFFLKGLLFSLGLFIRELSMINSHMYLKLFDITILVFLFIATLKR